MARVANRIHLVCGGAAVARHRPASAQAPAGAGSTPSRTSSPDCIRCWKPPPASRANPIDITVIVSFNRDGDILGHPRITYESEQATDNDRLIYRIAVMEALQRCTPMPFTEALGGAIAGRPFAIPVQITAETSTQTRQSKEHG